MTYYDYDESDIGWMKECGIWKEMQAEKEESLKKKLRKHQLLFELSRKQMITETASKRAMVGCMQKALLKIEEDKLQKEERKREAIRNWQNRLSGKIKHELSSKDAASEIIKNFHSTRRTDSNQEIT